MKKDKGTVLLSCDQLGREIAIESEITDAETTRTEKYYDLSGNVARERIKNNKAGESDSYSEIYYEYDSMHRPTAIKTNDGTRNIYTQYAYDSMGNVTKVVTGQTQKIDMSGEIPQTANVTEYQYDRFGNVTKTTDANGLFETAEYNFVGLPTSSTDKKGVTTAYTYNSYGSPLSVATTGVDAISYTYNVNNMPTSVTQGTNTTTYEYDTLGRLTKETENGIVKTYSLDKVGNRISSNVGGVETAYTYDSLNRLTGVTFDGGSANYGYDKRGMLTTETKGGIETAYTYNKAGWLTNKTNTKDNATTSYALTYSNDGNIVSRTENGEVTNYTYDGLGQLVAEDDTLYEYDTRGNRTKMTKDGVATEYRYDRTNKLMTENTEGVWTAYAYDQNGNNTLREVYEITADGTQNELDYLILNYDPLNRLTRAQKDGMTAEYTYGIDNMRRSKTVNGETQKFIWDGSNIVGITDVTGAITDKYYRGVGLVASYTDSLNYYQTNDHGDVSTWGNVAYNYDAFGNQEVQSNDGNPFRYTSEIFDEETGFIYLRNRYYEPSTGRFINEDPIRDGLNWYAYCGNNPVMFVDPLGLFDYDTKLSYSQNYNQDVEALQQRLVLIGYMQEPPAGEWGYFGTKTQDAVNKYKEDNNLWNFAQYRGVVGLTTWQHLGLTYRTQEDIDAGITIVMTSEREQYKDITLPLESALINVTQDAKIYNGTIYRSIWFVNKVTHGAPWDIKRKVPWENLIGGGTYPGLHTPVYYSGLIMTPEELGNYTYGYIGNVLGYSLEELYKASWIAAGAPTRYNDLKNEYGDWISIQMGFKDYD